MNAGLTDEVLGRLGDFATATLGLRFPPDRWSELSRGVASAALELGIPDIAGWVESLLNGGAGDADVKALANHLTIPETYFFRQRDTFTLLSETILPARLARRREQARPLRLWSAACSSGEEPYSIAILVRRLFPQVAPGAVVIHGTDINSHVLARAQRAVFSEWSFRDTPDWLKAAHFTRQPRGRYELAPEIRRMVKFTHLNLAAPLYPAEFGERGDFDVILCRNALMYFSADWQARILQRFVAALAPGGWLIVGPCDLAAPQAVKWKLEPAGPGVFQRAAEERGETKTKPAESAPPGPAPLWWPASTPATPAPQTAAPAPVPATAAPNQEAATSPSAAPPAAPAVASAEGESEAVSALAQAHADRGELSAALAACDDALARDKLHAGYHYLRACILQELERPAEAAEAFRRVLFLEPDAVMAHFALGCLADRRGDRAEARRLFQRVLRLLGPRNRGDAVPHGEGLTVGRLRAVIEDHLGDDAA